MAAMDDVGSVDDYLDDDDFDIDVVIQALDMDLSGHDEFCGGACYYSAIFSDADIVSHCRHGCDSDGDGGAAPAGGGWLLEELMGDDCGDRVEEEEAGSSSPADSGVTDDGTLAAAASDNADAEAVSAYVAELERFLLEDDDARCGEQADGLLSVVDDYFAGDQLLVTTEVVPAAGRAGRGRTSGENDEKNGDGGGDSRGRRIGLEEARKEHDQGNSHADAMGRA